MNFNTLCTITLLLALPTYAAADDLVIKVIEGKRILAEAADGKKIEAELMEVRNNLEADIKRLEKEIEDDVAKLRSKARTVDPSKSKSLEEDQEKILAKQKEIKMKAESAQEKFGRTVNSKLADFNKVVQDVVTELAKKLNWDMVILKETGEIIYISPKVNASNEVIKALDAAKKPAPTPGIKSAVPAPSAK